MNVVSQFAVFVAAAIALTACEQRANNPAGPEVGRYAGIGTYPAGERWRFVTGGTDRPDPRRATRADDEQIVVVIDRETGEVRQCGNLSGRCIAQNPWRASAGAILDREAIARAAEPTTVEEPRGGAMLDQNAIARPAAPAVDSR